MSSVKIKIGNLEFLSNAAAALSNYGNWYFRIGIMKNKKLIDEEIALVSKSKTGMAEEEKSKMHEGEIDFTPFRFSSERIPDSLSEDTVSMKSNEKEIPMTIDGLFSIFASMTDCVRDMEV